MEERFWRKVEKTATCWLWRGALDRRGYGRFSLRAGTHRFAHRVAYELLIGAVPADRELDHLCRVPGCVNPAHLEPVTHRENMLRGNTFAKAQAAQTHCKRGHPFDAVNTRTRLNGKRDCRACDRERAQDYRARLKAVIPLEGGNR